MRRITLFAIVLACLFVRSFAAHQTAPVQKVDFVKDVKPIFEQHCYDCHGEEKQMNAFRLDRRSAAMRGGTGTMIGGTALSSRLYLRLIGSSYGRQMPIEGESPSAAEIDTIRRWIDEGAVWPDGVSGDPVIQPLDPVAVRAFETLRRNDRDGFLAAVRGKPQLSTRRGPGGATPLMMAALYGDTALVKTLLDAGADPTVANDVGATALHWAAGEPDTVRILIAHGADVDARSTDGRTPLLVAASIRGNSPAVSLLLDKGANPSAASAAGYGAITAVTEAAKQGDEPMLRLLLARGANVTKTGAPALAFAIRSECAGCIEAIAGTLPPALLTSAMGLAAPPLGRAVATPMLLERGGDPQMKNGAGFPILLLAAGSTAMPVDAVKALLARGADIQATGPSGETALELARRHGETPMVQALLAAGAKDVIVSSPQPAFAPAASLALAVERSLPLLQRADVQFLQKTGCVSCHHNTQAAETLRLARGRGFRVDEQIAQQQRTRISEYLDQWRERALQGAGIAGDNATMAEILNGLAAERNPASFTTDAIARFVRRQQRADGSWLAFSGSRAPLEGNRVKATAEAIHALRHYAAPTERPLAEAAIARAAAWLKELQPETVQDSVYQVVGLHAVGAAPTAVAAAAQRVAAAQQPDGGWSQLPTLKSDAYATGEALVALLEHGAMPRQSPVVRRGLEYLRKTQLADGSWFVQRRAVPLQPYTDAGFPHGKDQFISASATHFATQALILATKSK